MRQTKQNKGKATEKPAKPAQKTGGFAIIGDDSPAEKAQMVNQGPVKWPTTEAILADILGRDPKTGSVPLKVVPGSRNPDLVNAYSVRGVLYNRFGVSWYANGGKGFVEAARKLAGIKDPKSLTPEDNRALQVQTAKDFAKLLGVPFK